MEEPKFFGRALYEEIWGGYQWFALVGHEDAAQDIYIRRPCPPRKTLRCSRAKKMNPPEMMQFFIRVHGFERVAAGSYPWGNKEPS